MIIVGLFFGCVVASWLFSSVVFSVVASSQMYSTVDARAIREGPTIADVYIDISPFYGMAPATVSGYRSGGRRYA